MRMRNILYKIKMVQCINAKERKEKKNTNMCFPLFSFLETERYTSGIFLVQYAENAVIFVALAKKQ